MAAPSLRQYTTTWGVDNGASTAFATLGVAPVAGNILVAVLSCRASGSAGAAIAGFTKIGPLKEYGVDCVSAFYKRAEVGDSATVTATGTTAGDRNFWVGEIQDTSGLDTSAYVEDMLAAIVTATVTPTAGLDHLLLAVTAFGNAGTSNNPNPTPTDGGTQIWYHGVAGEALHPWTAINHRTITNAAGSYSGGAQNHISDPPGNYNWGVFPPPPGTTIVLAFAGVAAAAQIFVGEPGGAYW